MSKIRVTLQQRRSLVERECEWCGRTFLTPTKGKATTRFCSKSHAAISSNSRPEVKEKIARKLQKIWPDKNCEICGQDYKIKTQKDYRRRRFCGTKCSAVWRMQQPEIRAKIYNDVVRQKVAQGNRRSFVQHPERRLALSRRMKEHNPLQDPEVKAKADAARRARPFPSEHGGNGRVSPTEQIMQKWTGWKTGAIGVTGIPKWKNLKMDLIEWEARLAVELDGASHLTKQQKERDCRKETILRHMKWNFVRIPNDRATESAADWLKLLASELKQGKVSQSTISKLPPKITLYLTS